MRSLVGPVGPGRRKCLGMANAAVELEGVCRWQTPSFTQNTEHQWQQYTGCVKWQQTPGEGGVNNISPLMPAFFSAEAWGASKAAVNSPVPPIQMDSNNCPLNYIVHMVSSHQGCCGLSLLSISELSYEGPFRETLAGPASRAAGLGRCRGFTAAKQRDKDKDRATPKFIPPTNVKSCSEYQNILMATAQFGCILAIIVSVAWRG